MKPSLIFSMLAVVLCGLAMTSCSSAVRDPEIDSSPRMFNWDNPWRVGAANDSLPITREG